MKRDNKSLTTENSNTYRSTWSSERRTYDNSTTNRQRQQQQQANNAGFWSYVSFSNISTILAVFLFYWSMKNANAFSIMRKVRIRQSSSSVFVSGRRSNVLEREKLDCVKSNQPILPEGTFARMVERRLLERFDPDEVQRVLQSWRLLEMDYEHKETIRDGVDQLAVSYVPGLTPKCFWDTKEFAWCKTLTNNYETIKQEFMTVMSDEDLLIKEGNNVWAGALTDDASAYGVGWSTLVLMDRGVWDPTNVSMFPKTSMIVNDCDAPAVEIFFASMKPNSSIKMHSDFTNFVLTSHLAIDIPYSGENKCRLTVGNDTRQWINGEVSLFDTSIMHDAVNESDKTRYILMLRLWHPELSIMERDALQFLYDCLEVPDLASPDIGKRFMAEQRVDMLHAFPSAEVEKAVKATNKLTKKSKKNKQKAGGKGFGK